MVIGRFARCFDYAWDETQACSRSYRITAAEIFAVCALDGCVIPVGSPSSSFRHDVTVHLLDFFPNNEWHVMVSIDFFLHSRTAHFCLLPFLFSGRPWLLTYVLGLRSYQFCNAKTTTTPPRPVARRFRAFFVCVVFLFSRSFVLYRLGPRRTSSSRIRCFTKELRWWAEEAQDVAVYIYIYEHLFCSNI